MAAPHRELRVRLQRDALTTPWGFRLQGGKDFKAPLTVQRVFVGSPADGELHRGDVIRTIENVDTSGLIHKQAQDLIKSAGGQLMLSVQRGQPVHSGYSAHQPASQPAKQIFRSRPWDSFYPKPAPAIGQVYRSRTLDTFTPKPAPKLGQFHPDAQSPGGTLSSTLCHHLHHEPPDTTHQGFRSRTLDTFTPKPAPKLGQMYPTPRPLGGVFGPKPSLHLGGYKPPEPAQKVLTRALAPFAPTSSANPRGHQSFKPKPGPSMYGGGSGSFGTDYTHRYGGPPPPPVQRAAPPAPTMLGRVNESLNQSIWHPSGEYDQQGDPDYQHKPVGEIKQLFGGHPRAPPAQSRPGGKAWKKPPASGGVLADPGWTPGMSKQTGGWSPVRGPANAPFHQRQPSAPAPVPVNRQTERPPHIEYDSRPAWAGTLKSAGGSKPWEVHAAAEAAGIAPPPQAQASQTHVPATQQHASANVQPHKPRVQNVHYGPGDTAPTYSQHDQQGEGHEGATVVHTQYNSPLALYSKQNVEEALEGQTAGGPGAGTMHVSGGGKAGAPIDFRQSDLARMIAEEDGRSQKPRGYGLRPSEPQQSARYEEHAPGEEMQYQGFQDHSRQSQSFKALETNMAMQGEDVGASDF